MLTLLGRGYEHEVFLDPTDPSKVIKVPRNDAMTIDDGDDERNWYFKEQFYLTKVLHAILPKNIPDVHRASIDEFDHVTIRAQRAYPNESYTKLMEAKMRSVFRRFDPEDTFSNRLTAHKSQLAHHTEYLKLKSMLKKLGIGIDSGAINFAFTESGELTYLDKISPILVEYTRSIRRLRKEIDKIEDQSSRNQAHRLLNRYEALTSNPRSPIHTMTQRNLRS